MKSRIRRVSQQQQPQQQQQQQQPQSSSSNGESKSDALVPFQATAGKIWDITEEKDHSMNTHTASTIISSMPSDRRAGTLTTMLDDDAGGHGVDDHFVNEKSGLEDDNDDDIGRLIRLAQADVVRNNGYINQATEDMNRAMARLEATKRDAQLAVDRLRQLKKLSTQISRTLINTATTTGIPKRQHEGSHDSDGDHALHVRPLPSSSTSSSTLTTARKNSQSHTNHRDHDHGHATDGASDVHQKSQQHQHQSQGQEQPKKSLLGRKRNNSSAPGDPPSS